MIDDIKPSVGSENSDRTEAQAPKDIVESLGFSESPEMAELKNKIILVGVEAPEFGDLYTKYQEAGEVLVESVTGMGGRVALMMKFADIIYKLGLTDDFWDAVDDIRLAVDNENDPTIQGIVSEWEQSFESKE